MHRFFVTDVHDDEVFFTEAQAHQLQRVLRLGPGDRVIALDNSGWEYEVILAQAGRREARGKIIARRFSENEPAVQLTLYQSLLKRDHFEWVLQKGTEIGVTRFVPLVTARSVATFKPGKPDRWQRILTEAAEQSRRGRIPELTPPIKLAEAVAQLDPSQLALMPWEDAAGATVHTALAGKRPASVALFIGPEGGFTAEEAENGRSRGLIPITLGKRILRAETAALVASALVLDELGEMEKP